MGLWNVQIDVLGMFKRSHVTFSIWRRIRWTGWNKKMSWNYFKPEEVEGLDPELVSKLDTARRVAGIPFIITSGKRTPVANERAMGVEGSSHIKGLAVDLGLGHLADGYERNHARYLMIKGLYASGFTRIIPYGSHIHVDIDKEKPQETMPLGGESH